MLSSVCRCGTDHTDVPTKGFCLPVSLIGIGHFPYDLNELTHTRYRRTANSAPSSAVREFLQSGSEGSCFLVRSCSN